MRRVAFAGDRFRLSGGGVKQIAHAMDYEADALEAQAVRC
jgi:hypothetical protein